MGVVKYSGPVASFHCPTNAEIRSLKVHFSPKQEGSGDPSPENVRPIVGWDGVNIEYTKNNLAQFEPYGSGSINLKWTPSKAILDTSSLIRYSIYIDNSNGGSEACIRAAFFDENGSRLQSRTRSSGVPIGQSKRDYFTIQPFPSGTSYVVFGIKGSNFTIKEPMIDIFQNNAFKETLYEPYQGSTTDYEFGVLGKNKFDYTNSDNWRYANTATNRLKTKPTNVDISIDNNVVTLDRNAERWGYSFILGNLVKGTSYCLSGNFTNIDGKAYIAKLDSETIQDDYTCTRLFTLKFTDNQVAFTPTENGIYELLMWNSGTDSISVSNLQLELGSTATTYEPYNPNHTVYGGWVDLISGEVVKTWMVRPISQMSVTKTNGAGVWQHRFDLRSPWVTGVGYEDAGGAYQAICSIFSFGTAETNFTYRTYAGLIDVYDDTTENAEDFKTKYGDYMVAYNIRSELYEHYHLAPTQLQTFLAQNNIWSNADYVEVEYDLHETQNILARKQFIIANQPHIEKLTAAPLQNFVTDMVAPLKECKIYFNPVQEGSGDPSPDNMREITGWNKLEIYKTGKNLVDHQKIPDCFLPETPYIIDGDYLHINYEYIRGYPDNTYMYLPAGIYTASIVKISGEKDVSADIRVSLNGQSWYGWAAPNYSTKQLPNGTNISTRLKGVGSTAAFQIEVGSVSTNFEPYNGTTIPITFPSEAGTIYGGYVDLVKGELVQEWTCFDLTQIDWSYWETTSNGLVWATAYPGRIKARNVAMCNILKFVQNPNVYGVEGVDWHTGRMNFCLSTSRNITTLNEFKQWLQDFKDNGNTPVVCANMETPTLYSLTPQILKSLRGTNNIWSNANGNIELSYWKH